MAAKEQGIYWIHWMIRHFRDCLQMPMKECRYWPEVHEKTNDPNNPYGPIIPVRGPGRHETILRQGNRILYEDEFDLATNMIHGPVNFGKGGKHVIPTQEWVIFKQKAAICELDMRDTDQIVPLS
jgi:hypothetical protein